MFIRVDNRISVLRGDWEGWSHYLEWPHKSHVMSRKTICPVSVGSWDNRAPLLLFWCFHTKVWNNLKVGVCLLSILHFVSYMIEYPISTIIGSSFLTQFQTFCLLYFSIEKSLRLQPHLWTSVMRSYSARVILPLIINVNDKRENIKYKDSNSNEKILVICSFNSNIYKVPIT